MFFVTATAQQGDSFFFGFEGKPAYFILVPGNEAAILLGKSCPAYGTTFPFLNKVRRRSKVFFPDVDFVL
jgi:hypothetical protein